MFSRALSSYHFSIFFFYSCGPGLWVTLYAKQKKKKKSLKFPILSLGRPSNSRHGTRFCKINVQPCRYL